MNKPATPPRSPPESAPVEPAQGHIDTRTQYRDRPTDDGKYGDAGQEPNEKDAE